MSWLYSRALVVEYLQAKSSAPVRSARSNGMPMPQAYLPRDRMTDYSRLSRSGMTLAPLMGSLGEELLTWYLADSHARTSARRDQAQELKVQDQVCGNKCIELLARYDLNSSSWKTVRSSSSEDLPWSSVTLPRSGMVCNGCVYPQPSVVPIMEEIGSGGWPTPIATEWKNGCGKTGNRHPDKAKKAGLKLSEAVRMWPTITVHGNYNRKGASKTSGDGLITAIWRTPNASDANKWSNQSLAERQERGQQIRLNTQVSPEGGKGGLLNPMWVEWLMGWPLGWTSLDALATDKYQEWLRQHSKF